MKISVNQIKKYVRATNYLTVAQIFLQDNFLLDDHDLNKSDIKPRLLGHFGTCPGINFVYANLNALIKRVERGNDHSNPNFLFILGPGHGFPAVQANLFVEGTLSKYDKKASYDYKGLKHVIKNFSWAYGYPSHSNPTAPGTILEGGELGYSLSTAYGSVLDNPDLITTCMVGDGEAETGAIATAWHCNKFINPRTDGAVLPILHLNGYKISGPTIYGRMDNTELKKLFEGFGYEVFFIEYGYWDIYHEMQETLDHIYKKIRKIQTNARKGKKYIKPRWPMIIMRTPKGWTGIKELDGKLIENNCASHQVVLTEAKTNDKQLKMLEAWLTSYKFNELYDKDKGFIKDIVDLIPNEKNRMGSNIHAFGGEIRKELKMPKISNYAMDLSVRYDHGRTPGRTQNDPQSATLILGKYFADIIKLNKKENNFRLFSPDETYSNKLQEIFKATKRVWQWPIYTDRDMDMAQYGKVIEMLSEQTLQGLMQGYILTGRHGVFPSYEAFLQVVTSMCDQYAKFLKASKDVSWRKPVSSFNYILSSLGWRQDHNGFSHQNPGFISNILEKKLNCANVYFPIDVNTALATMERCLKETDCINLIVCDKQKNPQWLTMDEAKKQVKDSLMIWEKYSDKNPDIIFGSAGEYPTIEVIEAIKILKKDLPDVKVRYVNVNEITSLGVTDPRSKTTLELFDKYFLKTKPVIFNYHGYANDIKHLIFDSITDPKLWYVHGYMEEGSTTTPFDMLVRNKIDRYHLMLDVLEILSPKSKVKSLKYKKLEEKYLKILEEHKKYIIKFGEDPKEMK